MGGGQLQGGGRAVPAGTEDRAVSPLGAHWPPVETARCQDPAQAAGIRPARSSPASSVRLHQFAATFLEDTWKGSLAILTTR